MHCVKLSIKKKRSGKKLTAMWPCFRTFPQSLAVTPVFHSKSMVTVRAGSWSGIIKQAIYSPDSGAKNPNCPDSASSERW